MSDVRLTIPGEFDAFLDHHRFKVAYGGRAGMRSWTIAQLLIYRAVKGRELILCAREFQTSMRDSAHRLIKAQIERLGLDAEFEIQRDIIKAKRSGSQFIFKGLHHNITEVKSTEGVTVAWVEEAENVSAESWDVLIPTVRAPGSEIWLSFNPGDEDAPTYQRFVVNSQPDQVTVFTTYLDTKERGWLPAEILQQAEFDRVNEPDRYEWVWMGKPRRISNSRIFSRWRVSDFQTPYDARFFHGADWGFSQDPTVLIRAFVRDNTLWIDREAYGRGVEMQELPDLFDSIGESARKWPIPSDNARPETIAYMQRAGFDCYGAAKWPGSIEDGIEYIKSFNEIVIHERCTHMADEARLYSYKVDKRSGEVLPVVLDAHNHCWDALRYALSNEIRDRGGDVEWIEV